ncbi:hypothetical protein HYH03_002817 [Edaphochlamys debaryana]|uniref:Tyrosine specific protein phosphatases domain-containing protein n=1 Tax=Edaphochlamys debaryana TaxID=47281 RepID=A0A835YDF5_9CHLO|nr:hypothetical protein HYH03_002817 [Edaphochlamys debaryana]|eukprot:KAG2499238.1 hypothetical protein HYH03_002817 [Edaphochlamys debaryana]
MAPASPATLTARLREALPNARDLHEAFPAIPPGRVIRCANPSATRPEDVDFLLGELRVRDLIDLRAREEMAEDDPGSVLMGRAVIRNYARGWLVPGQLFLKHDEPPQDPTPLSSYDPDPSASTSTSTAAPSHAVSTLSTAAAALASEGDRPEPSHDSQPPLSSSQPSGEASSRSGASRAPARPVLIRHHVSLLERGRYYMCLAGRIPATTTVQALLTNFVSKPAARALLLPYVNGGGLQLMYEMLLDSAQPEIRKVMEVLLDASEARHAVLFFCRAGKDRTGLVAAAVLAVAGASEEQIVADYTRSDAFHRVALAGLEKREELAGLDRAKFERAPPEAMRATLEYVRRRYGSFSGYLTHIGFGPEKQRRLRELLLSSDPQQ